MPRLSDPTDGGVAAPPDLSHPNVVRRAVVRVQRVGAGAQDRLRRLTAPFEERAARMVERFRRRFHSPLHSEWLAAVMGIALGVSFTVCFLTGMVDYLAQNPPSWFHLPVHPVNLYRVTEGVHVLTGIIAIPLALGQALGRLSQSVFLPAGPQCRPCA